jgi:hypothetical protein
MHNIDYETAAGRRVHQTGSMGMVNSPGGLEEEMREAVKEAARQEEARAAGFTAGLLAGLEWAFKVHPEGTPGGWLARLIKEVERTGELPKEGV